MEPPVAAAAEVAPEFMRYLAVHSLTDAYVTRAKVLRDIRHADDAFYARTVDEAADQRARDQQRVAGAETALPAKKQKPASQLGTTATTALAANMMPKQRTPGA